MFDFILENFLIKAQIFNGSKILNNTLEKDLIELCEFEKTQEWQLIYRASDDGFSASSFHSECDQYSDTLTIVKTTDNRIFGGWTEKGFDLNAIFTNDPNAFVVSLVDKEKKPFIKKVDNVFAYSDSGPEFIKDNNVFLDISLSSEREGYFNTDTVREDMRRGPPETYFTAIDVEVWHKIY